MAFKKIFGDGHPRFVALLALPLFALTACEDEEVAVSEVVRPVTAMKVSDVSAVKRRQFPGRAKAARLQDAARKHILLVDTDVAVGRRILPIEQLRLHADTAVSFRLDADSEDSALALIADWLGCKAPAA